MGVTITLYSQALYEDMLKECGDFVDPKYVATTNSSGIRMYLASCL